MKGDVVARRRLIGAAVCAVVLAACGDSGGVSDSKASSDDGGSVTTAAKSGTASGSGSSDSGSGSGSGALTTDCLAATTAFVAASASLSQVLAGDNKQFESSLAELNKWASSAPSALQKDLKVVAAGYAAYAKTLKDAGYKPGQTPDANLIKAMEKASAALETSEFEKANANVDAWFDKECSR
jgi:hypothetical protein